MKRVLILFYFLSTFKVLGQNNVLDSLNGILNKELSDSLRGYVLDELSYHWFYDNLDSSLHYARKSIRVFKDINNLEGLSRAYTDAAVAYHYKNVWDSAEVNYLKAGEAHRTRNNPLGEAGSMNNLGVLFMDKGDYKSAADNFLTSLKIKEEYGDSVGLISGNANLGLIFRKQGNYENALKYYTTALNIALELNQKQRLPTLYINMGSMYNFMLDFESGLKYNRLGLAISSKLNSSRYIGESYVNISDSYLGMDATDSSLIYIQKAIDIFRKNTDNVNLARALNSAASLQIQKKNFTEALKNSLEVSELNSSNNLDLKVKNALNLAIEYQSLGNNKKAYDALMEAYTSKDSLLNESLNETIVNLTAQYETEQKERKILELERDKIESDLDLAQSRNQRNIFILVAALILGVSVLLFFLYRLKSRSEATIAKSLNEKETLLKEIHHRVKNNLQVVSSLLSMQSRFIKDKEALGAVNEGQARVESMALIHQKLYQENHLSGVKAREYIEDLADVLKQSYSTNEDVDFEYDVDDLTIDVDTIIPIGLILNELICNSLKHAFPEETEGLVTIRLKENDQQLQLEVKDNGVGSKGQVSDQSFGMVLIESLAMKLKATLHIASENGTSTILNIGKYKLV